LGEMCKKVEGDECEERREMREVEGREEDQ
jgi:hypothetical protein